MISRIELPGFTLDLSGILNFPEKIPNDSLTLLKTQKDLQLKFDSGSVDFYDWPCHISKEEIQQIQEIASDIRSHYEAVLVVGIGGSYLGAAALMNALRLNLGEKGPIIHWISNVDPTSIQEAHLKLNGKKTAAVFISKSGNTVETLTVLYTCHTLFDSKSVFIVTDPKRGELRRLAEQFHWKSLSVPENIGGRFSVFTAVGLLPLEICGIPSDRLLTGARAMRAFLEKADVNENLAYLYAFAVYTWASKFDRPIHIFMPYDSALVELGDWFVQLWAESIGKKELGSENGVGFTPIRCLGTTDQHSQLQLFKDGPQDKVIGFVTLREKEQIQIPKNPYVSKEFEYLTNHSIETVNFEASRAVELSLQNSRTPTYRVTFKELSPEALGSFLFFQMTACAFAGELFHVNAFDQPGVEEAKRLLKEILRSP